MKNTKTILWLVVAGWLGCSPGPTQKQITTGANVADTTILQQATADTIVPPDYDTSQWTEVSRLLPDAVLDLRYATDNNFVDTVMYDCGRCFLRPEVALAIRDIQNELAEQGLGLKFFDCYRPRPIQYKLWEKVPDPRYVADPRKGSMHNRGAAVDLTIVDSDGKELDMGTDFDFFGPRAYHNYTELSDTILSNRQLLKNTMEKHQFRPTSTEWWHYSYIPKSYPISDMLWKCPL
jgi:D-alanyl-D-alanine dipeptidase